MKSLLFCVVCLHLGWTYGVPAGKGVSSFAYQDSSGNRYGGTYEIDDAQLYNSKGKTNEGPGGNWQNYAGAQVYSPQGGNFDSFAPYEQPFQQFDTFIPEYFSNLQNLLNEAFNSNFENQKLAYNAAKKAFDLTSNQAGYNPNFTSRLPNFDFDGFPFMMPFRGQNAAFAGAAAGPGYTHQMAALSPENPVDPNINVMHRFSEPARPGGNFYSVSSSSYSSSANVNGKEATRKGAETLVNNNGVVTHYRVQS